MEKARRRKRGGEKRRKGRKNLSPLSSLLSSALSPPHFLLRPFPPPPQSLTRSWFSVSGFRYFLRGLPVYHVEKILKIRRVESRYQQDQRKELEKLLRGRINPPLQ